MDLSNIKEVDREHLAVAEWAQIRSLCGVSNTHMQVEVYRAFFYLS